MRQIITKSLGSNLRRFPRTVGAYMVAFVATAVATALRFAIDPYVAGVQYLTFFPTVLIITLIGGLWPGIFSVVLSAVAASSSCYRPTGLSVFTAHAG